MPSWPKLYKQKTNRRKEWKALKTTHAAALKASKVDFDAKLGAAIDKFELQVTKMAAEEFGKKSDTQDWVKVGAAATQLTAIVKPYKTKVSNLPVPTKTAMTTFLKALEDDAEMWSEAAKAPTTLQKGQQVDEWGNVLSAVGHLEALLKRSQVLGEYIAGARAGGTVTDPAVQADMGPREALTGTIHDSTPAALEAAKKIEALRMNFGKDATYRTVLKQTGERALNGPWATLRQHLADYLALPAADTKSGYFGEAAAVKVLAGNLEREFAEIKTAIDSL
jgi:hypothetical protein